jgi:glyceraldehyde-3-phosphate dehydrogenase (NAD(P))
VPGRTARRGRFERAVTTTEVRSLLAEESRVALVSAEADPDSCGALQTFAGELDRRRGELWENCVWSGSVTADDTRPSLIQAIDQRCDVVPETVDAVRALTGATDGATSMARTDDHLGVGLPTVSAGSGPVEADRGTGTATDRRCEPR